MPEQHETDRSGGDELRIVQKKASVCRPMRLHRFLHHGLHDPLHGDRDSAIHRRSGSLQSVRHEIRHGRPWRDRQCCRQSRAESRSPVAPKSEGPVIRRHGSWPTPSTKSPSSGSSAPRTASRPLSSDPGTPPPRRSGGAGSRIGVTATCPTAPDAPPEFIVISDASY